MEKTSPSETYPSNKDQFAVLWSEFAPTGIKSEHYRSYYYPLDPVAASRPRVGKWGAYYSGSYAEFRKEAGAVVKKAIGSWEKQIPIFVNQPLRVTTILSCKKPANTSLAYPECDNDNYEKALWDQLNGLVWDDDRHIVINRTQKMWECLAYPAGIYVTIETNGEVYKRDTRSKAAVSKVSKSR